jgi:hypothetical protein
VVTETRKTVDGLLTHPLLADDVANGVNPVLLPQQKDQKNIVTILVC